MGYSSVRCSLSHQLSYSLAGVSLCPTFDLSPSWSRFTLHCVVMSHRCPSDSPAGAFFGQDEGELGPGAALQRGVGNIHVDEAGDLRHVTKGVLHYHHVVSGAWRTRGWRSGFVQAAGSIQLLCMALLSECSLTVFVLEEERRAAALQLAPGHDGDAVAQQVGLVHEVCGEQDGAAALLALQQVPGGAAG